MTHIPRSIKEQFSASAKRVGRSILAPPISHNFAYVGEVFDLMLRIFVKRINQNAKMSLWQACQHSFLINQHLERQLPAAPNDPFLLNYVQAKEILRKSKKAVQSFFQTGIINEHFVSAVFALSRFERGSWFYLREPTERDVADVMNLFSIVDSEMFKAKNLAVLAPTPRGSNYYIGTIDLLIDDSIIDIKTTSELELKKSYVDQIFRAYHIFNQKGVSRVRKRLSIRKGGIYFSRYRYLFTFDISRLFT